MDLAEAVRERNAAEARAAELEIQLDNRVRFEGNVLQGQEQDSEAGGVEECAALACAELRNADLQRQLELVKAEAEGQITEASALNDRESKALRAAASAEAEAAAAEAGAAAARAEAARDRVARESAESDIHIAREEIRRLTTQNEVLALQNNALAEELLGTNEALRDAGKMLQELEAQQRRGLAERDGLVHQVGALRQRLAEWRGDWYETSHHTAEHEIESPGLSSTSRPRLLTNAGANDGTDGFPTEAQEALVLVSVLRERLVRQEADLSRREREVSAAAAAVRAQASAGAAVGQEVSKDVLSLGAALDDARVRGAYLEARLSAQELPYSEADLPRWQGAAREGAPGPRSSETSQAQWESSRRASANFASSDSVRALGDGERDLKRRSVSARSSPPDILEPPSLLTGAGVAVRMPPQPLGTLPLGASLESPSRWDSVEWRTRAVQGL
jgi:hypothetical protein